MSKEDKVLEAIPLIGKSADDRFLFEILKEDVDQVDLAFRSSKRFYFSERIKAYEFQGWCVLTAMKLLGVPDPEMAFIGFCGMDRLYDYPGKCPGDVGFRIEKRVYHHADESGRDLDPDNAWRSGIYIYRMKGNMVDHDNLAFFVSNVKRGQLSTTGVLLGSNEPYAVMTNVDVKDERKKIYSFSKTVAVKNIQDKQ